MPHSGRLPPNRPRSKASLGLVLGLLFLLLIPAQIQAATLFGVVSERASTEFAAGTEQFARQHPNHELILRTPEQLEALGDAELKRLWARADAVLITAVFGDAAARLVRLLQEQPPRTLIALHADQRLVRMARRQGKPLLDGIDPDTLRDFTRSPASDEDTQNQLAEQLNAYPEQAYWLTARAYYAGRGSENLANLIAWLLQDANSRLAPAAPQPQAPVRLFHRNQPLAGPEELPARRVVALLDHHTGDRAGDRDLHLTLCDALQAKELTCLSLFARWGEPSVAALAKLEPLAQSGRLAAIVSLQDFVIGGGDAREQADQAMLSLDVPVLKGIRLMERSEAQWRLSEDGMPWDSTHYQVAMPEVQGVSQPLLLAAAGPRRLHELTGLALRTSRPVAEQVAMAADRIQRWAALQEKPTADKRIAIVYYNHPPGRHNIGADNLDVPASLWELLHSLKAAGYDTGPLPATPEALLDLIQEQGVNLPEDRGQLAAMAPLIASLAADDYRRWFGTLPAAARAEVVEGPLGYLDSKMRAAMTTGEPELGKAVLDRIHHDLEHMLEGADHPARERAIDLLDQLDELYAQILRGDSQDWEQAQSLRRALIRTGIEGLRGWGEAPGKVMVHEDRLLIPGMRFGNIFIGPQPPRGWELDEELLHANTAVPPPHQYLAYYHWIRDVFKADAVTHLGRHSTAEFLPRRRLGLAGDDFPSIIASDLPNIYPYIVDGVGEGIQAKRRSHAVIISHLTPPLAATELYDELLELRQLIESFEVTEGAPDSPIHKRAVAAIRAAIERLDMKDELTAFMAEDLAIRGQSFDEADDHLLAHEVGHYLTEMQEQFMPYGLHVLGRDWREEQIDLMIESLGKPEYRDQLTASPGAERAAVLAALEGRFVAPGRGNDPIRSPEALPTGRNFHALDSSVLPTRIGYELGVELATTARAQSRSNEGGSEAVVMWASDTVRDEGAMAAFGLDMLGIRPLWNARGILRGLERVELDDERVRRDVVFSTSGLFRDLYPDLLVWLDRAVLLALDGSSKTIEAEHPQLSEALASALAPLGELRAPAAEPLTVNRVAANWVASSRELVEDGMEPAQAGRQAALRIFGAAPGAYGAGINRLVERSGSWQERSEVAGAYLQRMGHAYGIGRHGEAAQQAYKNTLTRVENTYLGRASNLYGLLDNNDAFDFLGGLSLAVETLTGAVPNNHVINHADPNNARMQPLTSALMQELRGRHLNPVFLQALMAHDYAGARSMGSDFLEYLWGWQVTNPDVIKSWVWDEVKRVYLDDGHEIGLDQFLESGHKVHVKTNMQAILLVAAHKGFWEAGAQTLAELAGEFAALVAEHGLPGSGHTRPDHPMLEWLRDNHLDEQQAAALTEVQDAALGPAEAATGAQPTRIAELEPTPETTQGEGDITAYWWLIILLALLYIAGMISGLRTGQVWPRLRGR